MIDNCFRAGANSVFIGTTRDMFEGSKVTHLSYEAYPDMAIESMKEIVKTVLISILCFPSS